MAPGRLLIAGCGYVGTALALLRIARGDDVFGLKRHPIQLPSGVVAVEADLAVPRSLDVLPPKLDTVVYCASPSGRDDATYRTAYVEGLGNLLSTLERTGQSPRRVILTTSTAVYAQSHGEWVDEDSPTEPEHFSGRRLLEAEALLAASPFPGVALRLGGIYGPRRTRLVERVRKGQAFIARGAPQYTNRIHRDDCAGVIDHLLELPEPDPLYVGVDDEPAEEGEVLRWLAGVLGAPEPQTAQRGQEPMRRSGSKRCRNQRLRSSGYAFRFPSYREGYTAVLSASGR